MIKKIFANFLLAVFVLNLAGVSYAEEAKSENPIIEQNFQLITNLNLFNNVPEFDPNAVMTGSNFITIISNVLKSDVTEIYSSIAKKDRVVGIDVVKVFVELLGYNVQADIDGGYPAGYLTQAMRLKLFKNIKFDEAGQGITYNDLATIIYNCFNIEICSMVSTGDRTVYTTNNDNTFLTKILKLKKVFGQVTANNITGANDPNGVGNRIKIDGSLYELTDKTRDYNQFLGQYVDAYYDIDDKQNTLIYAMLNDKYGTLTIDARDITSYSQYKLGFITDGLSKEYFEQITKDAFVIYNGVALNNYDSHTFDFDYGNVVLVKDSSGNNSTVIITHYMDFVVSGINSIDSILYNEISDDDTETNDVSIEFNKDVLKSTYIRLSDGQEASFSSIKVGDVLSVAKNDKYIEVIISKTQVKGFNITEKSEDSDGITIISGDKSYKISNYFINSNKFKIAPNKFKDLEVGDIVNLSINHFNDVALITYEALPGVSSGYFVKSFCSSGLEAELTVKIFRKDAVMKIYKVAKRIEIMDQNGNIQTYDVENAAKKINGLTGVVKYRLNADDEIVGLDLPLNSFDANNPSKLHKINFESDRDYTFKQNIKTLGGQYYFATDLVMYYIPKDADNDNEYVTRPITYWDNNYNPRNDQCEAFSEDEESVIINTMVFKDRVRGMPAKAPVFAVLKVSDVLKDDGTTAKRIIGMENGTKVVLDSDTGAFDNALDIPSSAQANNAPRPRYSVCEGDVIRYSKVPGTGMVDYVEIIFSPRIENPAFPVIDGGQRGGLVGSSGLLDTKLGIGNPFGASDKSVIIPDSLNFRSSAFRVIYGWVYKKNGSIVTVTTQDLTLGTYSGKTGSYWVESYNISPFGKFTVMDLHGIETTAKSGDLSDISSFKEVGGSCSRFIGMTFYGEVGQIFVINGSLK